MYPIFPPSNNNVMDNINEKPRYRQGPASEFPMVNDSVRESKLGWHLLIKPGKDHGIFVAGEKQTCPKTWSKGKSIGVEGPVLDPVTQQQGFYYWIKQYTNGKKPPKQ